jgi:hypothetical protein
MRRPFVFSNFIFGLVLGSALVLAMGGVGCSSLPAVRPGDARCGGACETLNCPGAFYCAVDSRCVARCQPETLQPGKLF